MAGDIGDERQTPDEPDEIRRVLKRLPYPSSRQPIPPTPPGHQLGAVVPTEKLPSGEWRAIRKENTAQRPAQNDPGSIGNMNPQPALPSDSEMLRSIRSNSAWDRIRARGLSRSEQWLPDLAPGVGLRDAIQALSRALEQAWLDAQQQGSHFAFGPAEAKVHIIPSGQASGEVEWRVLPADGENSLQEELAHTLTLRFLPQSTPGNPGEDSEDEIASEKGLTEMSPTDTEIPNDYS